MLFLVSCSRCGEYETDRETAQLISQPHFEGAIHKVRENPAKYAGIGVKFPKGDCPHCAPINTLTGEAYAYLLKHKPAH